MLYGMDRENYAMPDDSVNQSESVPVTISEKPEVTEDTVNEAVANQDLHSLNNEPVHFTEKAASFLEAGVKVFYDIVVQILYQISQLFF